MKSYIVQKWYSQGFPSILGIFFNKTDAVSFCEQNQKTELGGFTLDMKILEDRILWHTDTCYWELKEYNVKTDKQYVLTESYGNYDHYTEIPIDFGYDKNYLQEMADELNKLSKEFFDNWQNLPQVYDNFEEIPQNKRIYYKEYYGRWNRINVKEYNYFVQECQLPGFKS